MPIKQLTLLNCVIRAELAALLDVGTPTLTYYAFGNGKKYKVFTIPKKSGGVRTISAPVGSLVEIQRRLAGILNDVYRPPSYVQGFVPHGSILQNASGHLNKRLVLNIDLDNFFPTITANRIIGLLRAKPFQFNNDITSTIAGLVCNDKVLPQGAPTSPVISNMICLRMDKALRALARREQATYSRYADDITFSTNSTVFPKSIIKSVDNGVVELGDELKEIISKNYFTINDKKTRLQANAMPKFVTGVKVNERPNLPRKYVRQVRSMLHAWERYSLDKAQEDYSAKYGGGKKQYNQVVRGKIAHLKNIKGEDDPVYRRLYNRYVRLEGKGRPELPVTEIEELYSKTFVIKSGSQYGTGFILDQKWLITCDHVVSSDDIDYFIHTDSMPILHKHAHADANSRSPETAFDLIAFPSISADLKTSAKSFQSAPASEEVIVGEECKIVGFPAYQLGSIPSIMRVEVTKLQRDKYNILEAYVDKKLVSGSSGSPVLNKKNQVIGIVRKGTLNSSTGDDSIGYSFLPIQEMRRCLEQFSEGLEDENRQ
jgi:RNA-directed DNA polymerase